MPEFTPKSKRLGKIIGYAPKMYRLLVDTVVMLEKTTTFDDTAKERLRVRIEDLLNEIGGTGGGD